MPGHQLLYNFGNMPSILSNFNLNDFLWSSVYFNVNESDPIGYEPVKLSVSPSVLVAIAFNIVSPLICISKLQVLPPCVRYKSPLENQISLLRLVEK
ncbi:MAG: hypothetical protein ACOCZ5_03155 [bacterium]